MSATADPTVEPVQAVIVTFGNPNPQMQERQDDGSLLSVAAPHLNQSVTTATMWDGFSDSEFVETALSTDNDRTLMRIARGLTDADRSYAVGLNELDQIIDVHAGGQSPAWVSCNDPMFQALIAQEFGCAQGDPSMLQTYAGRDTMINTHLGNFQYTGLTASTTAPATGDTTLAGEITTPGLARAACTIAHTAGTNTGTLTHTWTAGASDSIPVTIAQIGVFNASSGGVLGYHTALTTAQPFNAIGDSLTNTWTGNIG